MAGNPNPPNPRDALLDAIDSGLVTLDRGQRIVQWNAWTTSATGLSASAVLGKPLLEVFPGLGKSRLPGAVTSALESGASTLLTHALHPHLFPLRTRAGRDLLHDVSIAAIGRSPDAHCLIHIVDVTMAIRRERFLRERQNARYYAIVDSAADAIVTLDSDCIIRMANPATSRQFGHTAEELMGRHCGVLFDDQAAWAELWRDVLNGEKQNGRPPELVMRRKDGTLGYFEVSTSLWHNNTRPFVTVNLRDVSERHIAETALRSSEAQSRAIAQALADLNTTLEKRVEERTAQLMQAEEALRQGHKMEAIGQLTGGIAHDFNNLLQGIIAALEMVQKRVAAGTFDDVERYLKSAFDSSRRASSLTHRLLAFSRRQPIAPRPFNVNQLIDTTQELIRRSIGERVRLETRCAGELWLVHCDFNQLENALLNLVINARDAMPDGGTVTVETDNCILDNAMAVRYDLYPGEYVRLSVSDTGVGMSTEVQARAFDPFYTTKPIGQGTGLGLSMIYGFIRQSKGAVGIQSELGKGTALDIYLPRFHGMLAVDDKPVDPPADRDDDHHEVILVVEDEANVRSLVVEGLGESGYRMLEAADGASALRILQSSQRIDLLTTDIGLPDLNGRQVADAARVVRPKLKVLFMTGYAENAASSAFLEDGMAILSKPFTLDALEEKIRSMLADRG